MGSKAKNPAYRTQEQLVKDTTIILNAPLSYGTKQAMCRHVASKWTEHSGKYKGCPLWSKKAFEQYEATSKTKHLRHEHAVPKKVVVGGLLSLPNPTEDAVRSWFVLLVGVVVTRQEEKLLNSRFKSSMPSEFSDARSPSKLDLLLRYKACGIDVIGVEWPDN